MRLLSWLLFALALLLLFLTSWIVLPAPTRLLLMLAVGAPEYAPWLAAAGLLLSTLAMWRWRRARGTLGRATAGIAILATMTALFPLARVPLVVRQFDAAMDAALGHDYLRDVPQDRRARLRPSPILVSELYRGWAADLAVDDVQTTRGVSFVEHDSSDGEREHLTLDIYRPRADGRRADPCVVQIYGGAWQRGAPGDDTAFARYLASRGFVVFAIDYRHAPRWQWPAQIEDVRQALRWVRDHATEYNADASRLALIGRSSGAHLALLAAYDRGDISVNSIDSPDPIDPIDPIDAVVGYYGPVDLPEGYRDPPVPDPLDVRSILEAFLGGMPDQLPDRYRHASPITYVSTTATTASTATTRRPPTLLIHGSRDHIVLPRFSRMLDERLRATGTTSILLEIPWAEHAFDAIPNGPSGQISLYYTERFLTWALTGPRRP